MSYVVDASVFVSALQPTEVYHAASQQFLSETRQQGVPLLCPALVLSECAGAVARPTGNPVLAQQAVAVIDSIPDLRLISTNRTRARRAAQLAALHRLRGADAVYVAVATEFGATLVTWDTEMLQRGASVVTVMTPADAVAGMGTTPQT